MIEIGKYYRIYYNNDKYYFTPDIIGKHTVYTNWHIYNNKYFDTPAEVSDLNRLDEVPFSEIVDFLPDENLDKIIYLRRKKIKVLLNYDRR